MPLEISPQHLPLTDLAQKCEQETTLYFKHQSHDTRYCFELFRRAIKDGDKSAWAVLCNQYQPLVAGWVSQHYGFEASGEEVQYFVNGAFGKLSGTIKPDKFSQFSDVGSLLRYLKLCVHSVIIDHNRTVNQPHLYALDDVWEKESPDPSPEEQAMDRSDRQALWDLINTRLHNEKERAVVHGSFVFDLKPQELYDHFKSVFSDVDEIYRVKQNVLSRLGRDPEFRKLLRGDD